MSILGAEEITSQKPKQLLLALVLLLSGGGGQATADQVQPESVSHRLETKRGWIGNAEICSPQSQEFFPRQRTIPWVPVHSSRIAEADYYGRTFEASLKMDSRELFAYKLFMNIRGVPSYVSVALLGDQQRIVDTQKISQRAIFFLQDEAERLIRQLNIPEAYLIVTDSWNDVFIWQQAGNWYFSIKNNDRFVVFEFTERDIEYVCTYNGKGR